MAYSYVRYTGNGATTSFSITFPYISTDHLVIKLDGVEQSSGFTYPSASSVQFTSAPANGVVVELRRVTPKTSRLVDFQNGSILSESSLDLDSNQNFYIAQETLDDAVDALKLSASDVYDFNGKRAANAADPVNAQDLVTKAFAEANLLLAQVEAAAAASSASSAASSASSASSSASAAASSASSASTSASTATTKASEASASATAAASSATNASASATTATTKASEASASASTATTKASEASASASAAATSASNAASSATSASTSASTATTKASEASASATAAAASATAADASADAAAASALEAAGYASGVTFETLNANGDVGTGAAQVAAGNHNHDGTYATAAHNHDSTYAPKGDVASSGLTVATSKIVGRSTAGTGDLEAISVGTGLSLSGGTLSSSVTSVIKQIVSSTIAAATGTTSIPDDNTSPTNTEGTQLASLSITPTSASNKVRVRGNLSVVVDETTAKAQGGYIISVFRDSTLVGTVRRDAEIQLNEKLGGGVAFEFLDSPGVTTALTYSMRIGKIGGAENWYANRSASSATALNSSMANSIFTAEEVPA